MSEPNRVVFTSVAEAEETIYEAQRGAEGTAVRVIRGWKCGDNRSLHSEIGAALQFPPYYGENWDAMDECIRDLSWMPAPSYLIVVLDVGEILPADEDSFRTFLSILSDAVKVWRNPDPPFELPGRERPFTLMLAGDDKGVSRARAALER